MRQRQLRYQKPSHFGFLVHRNTRQRVKVRLTPLVAYWATPSAALYKKDSGIPKGSNDQALWYLDVSTIQELPS